MRIKVLIMTALLVAASNTNVSSQDMETKKTVTPQESKEHIVVLFEVKPQKEGKEEYLKLAAALKTELAKMSGFIRVERFASLNEEGKLLSLSVWENEDAAAAWRNQLNLGAARRKGMMRCLSVTISRWHPLAANTRRMTARKLRHIHTNSWE